MKLVLIGFIVGIGKIIPGVSGAMLALTLGVYEKLIDAVTNFFGDIKNNLKFLGKFGIGLVLAIVFFSKLILFLLNNYYQEVMYLFLGLIIGTLMIFMKDLRYNKKNIVVFLIFLLVTLGVCFNKVSLNNSLNENVFYIVFLGFIDALTSIIPGISGTVIYMMLGSYDKVLKILGNPFNKEFIIYSMGLFLGIIVTCVLMNYLLKRYRNEVYSGVLAFMIGSIFILFTRVIGYFNWEVLIFFLIGVVMGYLFER